MGVFSLKMKQLRRRLPSRRDWLMLLMGGIIVFAGMTTINRTEKPQMPLKPSGSGITISWIPPTVQRWKDPINEMSRKYDIDPNLIAIVMTLESGGYSKAHSEADAKGLMQITPPTAKDIAAKFLDKPTTSYDLWDPRTNIEFGTAYLAYLRGEFGAPQQGPTWNSTVELLAAGYNGGPGAANSLEQGTGLRDIQTASYSRDAFNMWRERHASNSPTFDRWQERGGSTLIDKAKAEK